MSLALEGNIELILNDRIYCVVGLGVSWNANSHARYYKRTMAIGLQQSIGNCGGLIVSEYKLFQAPVSIV